MVEQSTTPEPVTVSLAEGEAPPLGPGTQLRRRRAHQARGARKRIVIHAGIHRTGSTAIQHMLSTGRAGLLAQGVVYPEDFVPDHTPYQRQRNHTGLAWAILDRRVTGEQMLDWLADVVPSACDTVVLSAEDFCRLRHVGFLRHLQGKYDVEAVFYLRRQDHWLNSWYNQHVRWPFDAELSTQTPLEFLDNLDRFHWLQYFDLLERWAAVLGRENVHARVLEKPEVEDAPKDFLAILGVSSTAETVRTNESISADKLELLRRLHFVRFDQRQRMIVLDALDAIPSDRSNNVYDVGVRRLVMQRYGVQNQQVVRYYFAHRNGPLFLDQRYPKRDAALNAAPAFDEALALKLIEALAQPRG